MLTIDQERQLNNDLDEAFAKLEAGVREMAWGIVDEVMSLELASRKLGIKVKYPTPLARASMAITDDKTLNVFPVVRFPELNKRERFLKLIQEGTGLWKRADSAYFYKCMGESQTTPGKYTMQNADGYKTIEVTLVTLCSKWQHHPI